MATGKFRPARAATLVRDDTASRLRFASGSEAQPSVGQVARARLVALAYFLAAELREAPALPSAPVSALWAPTAILLAALLLTPPHRWWILMLAVLPAHLLVRAPYLPLSRVAIPYVANWGVALIGATALLVLAATRDDMVRRHPTPREAVESTALLAAPIEERRLLAKARAPTPSSDAASPREG